jgi:hypothetical protein
MEKTMENINKGKIKYNWAKGVLKPWRLVHYARLEQTTILTGNRRVSRINLLIYRSDCISTQTAAPIAAYGFLWWHGAIVCGLATVLALSWRWIPRGTENIFLALTHIHIIKIECLPLVPQQLGYFLAK